MESQDYSQLALRIVLPHLYRWDGGGSRDQSGIYLFEIKINYV
jgi:hypothetical protein